jgi:hypothetical protein
VEQCRQAPAAPQPASGRDKNFISHEIFPVLWSSFFRERAPAPRTCKRAFFISSIALSPRVRFEPSVPVQNTIERLQFNTVWGFPIPVTCTSLRCKVRQWGEIVRYLQITKPVHLYIKPKSLQIVSINNGPFQIQFK